MVGKVAVLIVDSEGTGAMVDSDVNHDTRIFALAVLLASTFVYNSVGAIDEGALEALGLVVNLTKFIQLKYICKSITLDPMRNQTKRTIKMLCHNSVGC